MQSTTDMQTGNLKLNKDKCHFRCTSILVFGEDISKHGVKPDPQKLKAHKRDAISKNKKGTPSILGIINYLSKFSPSTADICEPLRQLMSSETEWTWNATYQKLLNKAKSIITEV